MSAGVKFTVTSGQMKFQFIFVLQLKRLTLCAKTRNSRIVIYVQLANLFFLGTSRILLGESLTGPGANSMARPDTAIVGELTNMRVCDNR